MTYDAIQAVNFSTLRELARNPAAYWHRLHAEREDTAAMRRGRAVHCLSLEPETFPEQYAVWTDGDRRAKGYRAFEEANAGKEILTGTEYAEAKAIADAVRTDPVARPYITGGKAEVTITWDRTDDLGEATACKGRLDYVGPRGIVDLKSTRDASPDGFGKAAWLSHYHVQAAWYVDGFEAAHGERLPYWIVAAEADAPHVVQVYEVPDTLLEIGRATYREWLDIRDRCLATQSWPGYADAELVLQAPRWAGL